jgi:hypothetical protein
MAPKVASDIDAFPDKVEAGMRFGHHRLTIQRLGIHTTQHHLGFFPS